ncbi:MAG: ankyrin repeat domain-containing protein [Parachlamydiaceae bacterium]|nr:MAG: ankyrin repeat domain-containing protein [Parachlamydiaceae bacterium]
MNLQDIRNSFKSATKNEYWHHLMMKNDQGKDFYFKNKSSIDSRIQEIGRDSLERKDAKFGLTPLHVATIAGNKPGLQFLLRQKVSRTQIDNDQKTAQDYAQKFTP